MAPKKGKARAQPQPKDHEEGAEDDGPAAVTLGATGRPHRSGRTEHAAREFGLEKRYMVDISAGKAAKDAAKAKRKAARAAADAEKRRRVKVGERCLAHLEDKRHDQDELDDAEMRDASEGFDEAVASLEAAAIEIQARNQLATAEVEVDLEHDEDMDEEREEEHAPRPGTSKRSKLRSRRVSTASASDDSYSEPPAVQVRVKPVKKPTAKEKKAAHAEATRAGIAAHRNSQTGRKRAASTQEAAAHLKKTKQPNKAFADDFDPTARGALGRLSGGKPSQLDPVENPASLAPARIGSVLVRRRVVSDDKPDDSSSESEDTGPEEILSDPSPRVQRVIAKTRMGGAKKRGAQDRDDDSSEADEPAAFESVEKGRVASKNVGPAALQPRRRLVALIPSNDKVYKDPDFVQPPDRDDSPTKRRPKTVVEPQKSRGRAALPAWSHDVLDPLLSSIHRLYAGFYNPWKLDHPVADTHSGQAAYTFQNNFHDLLEIYAPDQLDEVVNEGKSNKVYKYCRNSMHTWWSTFQRHADSFVKEQMKRIRTKPEIAKVAEKALDRDRGEAYWAFDAKGRPDGALQSKAIVYVLALQLQHPEFATDTVDYGFPGGALALAVVAVQRAYAAYKSGSLVPTPGFTDASESETLLVREIDVPMVLEKPHRCAQLLARIADARQVIKVRVTQEASTLGASSRSKRAPIADRSPPPAIEASPTPARSRKR